MSKYNRIFFIFLNLDSQYKNIIIFKKWHHYNFLRIKVNENYNFIKLLID